MLSASIIFLKNASTNVAKQTLRVFVAATAVFFGTIGTLLMCVRATTMVSTSTLLLSATVALLVCLSSVAGFLQLMDHQR